LALVSAAGGHVPAFKKHDLVDEDGVSVHLGFTTLVTDLFLVLQHNSSFYLPFPPSDTLFPIDTFDDVRHHNLSVLQRCPRSYCRCLAFFAVPEHRAPIIKWTSDERWSMAKIGAIPPGEARCLCSLVRCRRSRGCRIWWSV
jgi:hypothetical protein